jgi:hypothetical protein
MFNPKWIGEFLNPIFNVLLNWKVTASVALAAIILLSLNARHSLPVALEPAFIVGIVCAGVLCACLAILSALSSLWTATAGPLARLVARKRDKKRIEAEIGFLTPKERSIISFLLANNQKMFEVLPDGEEAITLIAKGFVVHPVRHPMAFHRDIAVEIPDHVWDVLTKHKDRFPYEPPKHGEPDIVPWRTNWMAR